jgi:hypothetical protein
MVLLARMGPARAVQGLWGGFMVTPNTVGGHFSHPVWQAAVHEAHGSEAQNKTESQDSLRHGQEKMQGQAGGYLCSLGRKIWQETSEGARR